MLRFKFKRLNIRLLLILLIAVFGVSLKVGYAYLTQDLSIGGTAVASKNVWDVHFVDGSIVETTHFNPCVGGNTCSVVTQNAEIDEDGTSIDFGVTFHVIGDAYEFTVDVVNDGTIDAMLNDVVKENFSSYSSYLNFDVTYSDGMPIMQYDKLAKCGGTEKLKAVVTFVNAPANDVAASMGITVNYIQADANMNYRAIDPATRIRNLNTIGTSIADDDPDGNLRFIGSNPNNYVSFNGQKWRIIGVFDGKLKLVQDPIGNFSWDTSRNNVNNGYGVNQWGPSSNYQGADLMKLLNPGYESNSDLLCKTSTSVTDGVANCGDNSDSNYTTGLVNNSLYWNASSGKCYTYGNYGNGNCNFTSTGLKDAASKNMIENATWNLGSNSASVNIWDGRLNAAYMYNFERGSLSSKQCSSGGYCTDTVVRTTTWTGKVGLIYPSDYAYATSGGTTHDRNTCLTVHAGYVSDSTPNWVNTYTDCKNNDWLLNTSSWTWTLSPRAHSSRSADVFYVHSAGNVTSYRAMNAGSVRPVVFLKSSVAFTEEGNGTQSTPFVLKDTSA